LKALLVDLHLILGLALVFLVAAILVLALPAALAGRRPPQLYIPLHRLAAAVIGLQIVLGALLLATGKRPGTVLHLVYALAALMVMPAARLMIRRDPGHGRVYQIGATTLLLGVLFRLVTTG
jgi:drug/metabolite transporter (DMT)-like permease